MALRYAAPMSLQPADLRPEARAPHLLVCVMADGQASALLAQARQLHRVMGGSWSVVGVDASEADTEARAHGAGLLQALDEAERDGATTHRVNVANASRRDVLATVVQRARRAGATTLLIGRPHVHSALWRTPVEQLSRLADELVELLPGVTVHVLATSNPAAEAAAQRGASVRAGEARQPSSHPTWHPTWREDWREDWGTVCTVLTACTLLGLALDTAFEFSNLVMVYLAGVTYVALRKSATAALLTTVGGTLLFYLLFVPPRWSLIPSDPEHSFTFAVMLAVGLVISRLAARSRRQAQAAEARSQRAQALNQCALRLAQARTAEAVADAVSSAVTQTMGSPARLFLLDASGQLPPAPASASQALAAAWPAAQAALRERRDTGAGTVVQPGAPARFIPLLGGPGPLGLLAASRLPQPARFAEETAEDEHLLRAFANQACLALERVVYEQRSAAAAVEAETERLRNTLLAGVSHDFRTPLTTIVGAATSLIEQGHALDAAQRQLLLHSVLEQAQRLHTLSSDLLDMARMEEGAVRLNPEWCPADELVAEGLAAMGERVNGHRLLVQAEPADVVWCDPRLLQQALVNLVDNATRHAPAGAKIRVAVAVAGSTWKLSVQDDGPGVPAGLEREVFKKFFRGPAGAEGSNPASAGHAGHADATKGTGLGLAICAAVAQLHGGSIEVTPGPGAHFTMRLPQPERAQVAMEEDA